MTKTKTSEQSSSSPVPLWVREMHSYYQETGTYRAEDVQRVLGDPGDSFEGKSCGDANFNILSRR